MPAVACFCGASFASVELLYQHATHDGHVLMCGCGTLFKGLPQLRHHQSAANHEASTDYIEHPSLKNYKVPSSSAGDSTSLKCGFCPSKNAFKDAASLKFHMVDKHPTCPTCQQTFHGNAASKQLFGHQKAARHCYCSEHECAFRNYAALATHKRGETHVTGFECVDCGRDFTTEQGLDDHVKACPTQMKETSNNETRAKAVLAAAEEEKLRCEACNKSFKDLKAFKQHKASVKHNPLSDLTCFLSEKCTQKFTSPSAWLFHIESGKCKSGMTCQKLYGIVHAHDIDRHITHACNCPTVASIATSSLRGSLTRTNLLPFGQQLARLSSSVSSQDGVILTPGDSEASANTMSSKSIILTPDDSDASTETMSSGGVHLTPDNSDTDTEIFNYGVAVPTSSKTSSRSSASSDNGVLLTPTSTNQGIDEWSHIKHHLNLTPATSSAAGSSAETVKYNSVLKVWPCTICEKTFKTKRRLLQHINSPAHAPRLFHCPPAAVLGLSGVKPEKGFKTLSGFAQHIETGACNGGMEVLKKLINICEERVKVATGRDVKLLRDP